MLFYSYVWAFILWSKDYYNNEVQFLVKKSINNIIKTYKPCEIGAWQPPEFTVENINYIKNTVVVWSLT